MSIKYIKQFSIPYWINRKLDLDLFWRFSNIENIKELILTIWKVKRLTDYKCHENEWGSNWWKHIVIWKSKGRLRQEE